MLLFSPKRWLMYAALVTAGCGFRHEGLVRNQNILQRTDTKGRVYSRTFDQVVHYEGRNYVATITQDFDTIGRLVAEYGTDHPSLGPNYFFDVFYFDSTTVINRFRWGRAETVSLDTLPLTAFVSQRILTDSASLIKVTEINRVSLTNGWFVGDYFESHPVKGPRSVTGPPVMPAKYRFKIPLRQLKFDGKRLLQLKDALRIDW